MRCREKQVRLPLHPEAPITGSGFKQTVRIFKNMRHRLIDDRLLRDGAAPSYYIEGLLSNVPDTFCRPARCDHAQCLALDLQL
jgi:hypothetical protein